MPKLDLLAIGEAMAEIRTDGDTQSAANFKIGFAGDTFNTAVYCKRAAAEKSAGFLTVVGRDTLSGAFVEFAKSNGIDTSNISYDDDRNIGIYSVATDYAGERSFSYWRQASAARQLFADDRGPIDLPPAHVYYLSGITLAIMAPQSRHRLLQYLKQQSSATGSLIAFDSNYRPNLWESQKAAQQTIAEMWEIADIAFPSIDDEMNLFGSSTEAEIVDRFRSQKWAACAIKRGARGPLSTDIPINALPKFEQAAFVVDTTAAGDSFNGSYLAAFLDGKDENTCLLEAHNTACHVVSRSGAIV